MSRPTRVRRPTHRLARAGIPTQGFVAKLSRARSVSGVPNRPSPAHPKPRVPAAAGRSLHLRAAPRSLPLLLARPDPGAARRVPELPPPPPLPPPVRPPRLPGAAAPRLALSRGRRNPRRPRLGGSPQPPPHRVSLPAAGTHRRWEPAARPALPAARRWGSTEPPGWAGIPSLW